MIVLDTILAFSPSLTVMYPTSDPSSDPFLDFEKPVPIDTVLDSRYQIVKVLGQGGLGRTYLAVDNKRFDRNCVVKEFCPRNVSEAAIPKALELFEREAKTLDRLSHPQIPKFHGWFLQDNRWFLVQDYIEGLTYADILRQRLQRGQTFSEIEAIQWLKDLLPVLAYIHAQGVIHRDISPDNIMQPSIQESGDRSDRQNEPLSMLIDFGVAKVIEAGVDISPEARKIWGTTVGKHAFSAPEQMLTGECSSSSDLYSLALSALNLLTGKDRWELFNNGTKNWRWDTPVPLSDPFIRILSKLLREQPQDRYQSATEVLKDLKGMEQGGGSTEGLSNNKTNNSGYQLNPNQLKIRALVWRGLVGIVCIAIFGTIVGIWLPRNSEVCRLLNNCPKNTDLFDKSK
ncbi:serine/threonine-protein kinase [Pseudanabaena sp. PCC 6802]|uniref:serine/threonine-protein kinase n=1 Tax=Pseudanabaena sp. PCC 6802 TaxID=118173 RepID=UPI000683E31E|nr:serine/threonine-protein kinase [Pseudanabaena sp. PCC 6802]